jgi:hypothetical protein
MLCNFSGGVFTEWGHGIGDEVWDLKYHSKVTDEQMLK